MRPTHSVPGAGTYRELTIWKGLVFGILTLGIYFLVLVYQSTKDIQEARREPLSAWQVFFWLGLLLGPLHIVLYVFNGVGLKELRDQTRQADSPMWIVALILALVIPPIGQILWASHFNETVRAAANTPAPVAAPSPPTTMPA